MANAHTFYPTNTNGRVNKEYVEVDVKMTLSRFKKVALSIRQIYFSHELLKHDKAEV
jgi:hypothetical protein